MPAHPPCLFVKISSSYSFDIINYRKGLPEKRQFFTLSTELILIAFFLKTLSKPYTDFDSDRMYLMVFAQ